MHASPAPPGAEAIPDPVLEAAAREALAGSRARVIVFKAGGRDYVAKRIQAKPRARLKQWLLTRIARLVLGDHVRTGDVRPGDGRFEARRVANLGAAGVNVPRIALELPEAIIYSYGGSRLSSYLRAQPAHERAVILVQALDDLAAFHRAGHWHGGAQLKNILIQDGRLCRIDFEEDFEGRFSLPLLQLYDLSLFLNKAMVYADSEAAPEFLGMSLATRYRQQHWSSGLEDVLQRVARLMRLILYLEPLLRRVSHPEWKRALALARVLSSLASAE